MRDCLQYLLRSDRVRNSLPGNWQVLLEIEYCRLVQGVLPWEWMLAEGGSSLLGLLCFFNRAADFWAASRWSWESGPGETGSGQKAEKGAETRETGSGQERAEVQRSEQFSEQVAGASRAAEGS